MSKLERLRLDIDATVVNGRNVPVKEDRERLQCTWEESDLPGTVLSSIPSYP
jgi:hypothetical protein